MSEPSVTVELFDAAEMDVQIRKMAHQVLGDFPDEERIKLVGIRRRGVSVADRLAAHLSRITGRAFDQGEITLKRYSDTLEVLHPVPVLTEAKIPFDVTGQWVILVDDVFYTGLTQWAAIQVILNHGSPEAVRVAVLASRLKGVIPIHAHYVGSWLTVAETDVIEVRVREYDGEERIILTGRERRDTPSAS